MDRTRTIIAFAALFTGSLGTFLLTLYLNRDTQVAYTISSVAIIDADAADSSLDLEAQLDGTPVESLYSHSIELWASAGKDSDSAKIELRFPTGGRIYKWQSNGSETGLRTIECEQAVSSGTLLCDLSPLRPGNDHRFQIALFSDFAILPEPDIEGEGVRLIASGSSSAESEVMKVMALSILGTVLLITGMVLARSAVS